MDRSSYLAAVKSQLETNIYYHSLALEACMNGLYDYFSQHNLLSASDPAKDEWALAGLIHDIDYSGQYKPDHPNQTTTVLKLYDLSVSDSVLNMVKAHAPDLTGRQPQNKAEWSIFCADSLTGLIVAVALVYPTKKLADVKLSSVLKRFLKEPKFAAGTRRDEVSMCQNADGLNLPLETFIDICLKSMQAIAPNIGL